MSKFRPLVDIIREDYGIIMPQRCNDPNRAQELLYFLSILKMSVPLNIRKYFTVRGDMIDTELTLICKENEQLIHTGFGDIPHYTLTDKIGNRYHLYPNGILTESNGLTVSAPYFTV